MISPGPGVLVGASWYVDAGPKLVCTEAKEVGGWVGGPEIPVKGDVPTWEFGVGPGGEALDPHAGPVLCAYPAGMLGGGSGPGTFDGGGFAVAVHGEDRLTVNEVFADLGTPWLMYSPVVRDRAEARHSVGIPGYQYPGRPLELPTDYMALGAAAPHMLVVGDELWLVTGKRPGGRVEITHCRWGEWTLEGWSPAIALGNGVWPSIATVPARGTWVGFSERPQSEGPDDDLRAKGRLMVSSSQDGDTWVLHHVGTEDKARWATLAADPEAGLVMVYSAERGDAIPLFAMRSANFGETWGEPVMIGPPDARWARPDALAFEGRVYVAMVDVGSGPIGYRISPPSLRSTGAFTLAFDPMNLAVDNATPSKVIGEDDLVHGRTLREYRLFLTGEWQ